MDYKLRPYVAELIGTFVLVYVAAASVCAAHLPQEGQPRLELWGVALAQGCAYAVLLAATWHVSCGCLNPALTLMFWVIRRLEGKQALGLVAVQLLGSALAGMAVYASFSENVRILARLGAPSLKETILGQTMTITIQAQLVGIGVELILTALLTFAVFAFLLDPRARKYGSLGVGLAQVAVVLVGFHLTGGSANPATWFGPALAELAVPALRDFALADHTVYWVGPTLGALAGGYLYSTVILPPEADGGPRP